MQVLNYIKGAELQGAKIECGGKRVILEGELVDGQYLSPCVLTNCHDKMTAVQEEIFGSVAIILPFDSEEEVIKRANDTAFGLGGEPAARVVFKFLFDRECLGRGSTCEKVLLVVLVLSSLC